MKQMKRKLGILLFGIMLVFAFSIPVMAKNVAEKKEISATAQKVEHVIENQNTRLLNNNVPAGLANSIEDNIVEMGKYSSDTRYLTGVAPRENDVITQGEKLYIKFYARDTWKYYYTKPIVSVFNAAYLFILVVIMSLLLVAEIPMFSLKFKSLAWKQNKVSYIFLIVCIPLLAFFKISSFAAIILWYIILSLLTKKRA